MTQRKEEEEQPLHGATVKTAVTFLPASDATIVTLFVAVTLWVGIVNVTLVEPGATVALAGGVAAALLDESITTVR